MTTKRFCLALDLKDDPVLIEEYKNHHRHIWPEVYRSIKNAGIVEMEIYLFGNRLFMIMETVPEFTFEVKALADAANPKVREWEELMWKYQQAVPGSKPYDKWKLMSVIFKLSESAD